MAKINNKNNTSDSWIKLNKFKYSFQDLKFNRKLKK